MTSPVGLTCQIGGPELVVPITDEVCHLYDAVFSQPPFHWRDDESGLHRDRLSRLLSDPSFGVAVAFRSDRLIGFGYGFALPATTSRWAAVVPAPPADVAAEWPGRTFMLFDFAVDPGERGKGVGRRLHDSLLGSRPEERATLTVQPTAADTKAIYEHWGWRPVGQMEGGPTAAAPVFDTYLRDDLDDLRRTYAKP